MKNFIVEPNYAGARLDRFLTDKLGQPRNQLQKAIKAGLILVNGKPAKVHAFLSVKDVVRIEEREKAGDREIKRSGDQGSKIKFKTKLPTVMAITDDYIILEKPAGMLIHATKSSDEATLVDWLVAEYPEVKKVADPEALLHHNEFYRPGIIHRLDRDVSGVMLVARTQAAFDYYKKLFQERKIHKEYTALLNGELPLEAGEIDFEISRKSSGERMAAHPHGSGKGRPSRTKYEVLNRYINYTLVKAEPLTGRTNQIRVHFQALGFPIAGDTVYGKRGPEAKKIAANRIFLHASKISFIDQYGAEQTYSAELPTELSEVIGGLKKAFIRPMKK